MTTLLSQEYGQPRKAVASPARRRRSAEPHQRTPVSAIQPDWSRERIRRFWDPGRQLLAAVRVYQRMHRAWHKPARIFAVLRYRFWSVISGADVPLNAVIGGGLLLPHPNGVVIHPEAEIGPNCLLFQQVTIGAGGPIPGVPTLGGHVDVGAGARILGGVRIGHHARIGANAVVICDVPDGATAVGIPARVVDDGHRQSVRDAAGERQAQ